MVHMSRISGEKAMASRLLVCGSTRSMIPYLLPVSVRISLSRAEEMSFKESEEMIIREILATAAFMADSTASFCSACFRAVTSSKMATTSPDGSLYR